MIAELIYHETTYTTYTIEPEDDYTAEEIMEMIESGDAWPDGGWIVQAGERGKPEAIARILHEDEDMDDVYWEVTELTQEEQERIAKDYYGEEEEIAADVTKAT